jgi:hypothetical protein
MITILTSSRLVVDGRSLGQHLAVVHHRRSHRFVVNICKSLIYLGLPLGAALPAAPAIAWVRRPDGETVDESEDEPKPG